MRGYVHVFTDWLYSLPLGVLGLVRWVRWLIRRIPAPLYRPVRNNHYEPVSVVVPVYQEDPVIFSHAIESWLANNVAEVILVIDASDRICQEVAARHPVNVVITQTPGKRDALRVGWERASMPIVALVGSDTVWAEDVAKQLCWPLADPRVGGVSTRQNVYNPKGLLQHVNDMYLDYRYVDENAAQTAAGRAISCMSERRVVYWRALCLTSLQLKPGHRTVLQRSARVWSTFPGMLRTFFQQRAPNTWRSDIRALWIERWAWRYPFLAYTAGLRTAGLLVAGLTAGLVLLGASPAQASPGGPHNPRPPAGIGNGQVIVLRPYRADLVRNRVVVRVVPLFSGPVSLDTLVRAINDDRWASMSNGDVTLKAGLLQRPRTELRVGPAVHKLTMVDSADSPAYLAGTSSSVVFNGVTVVSSSGSGPAAESEHRPYVRYTHGSTVTTTGTTFQALGGRPAAGHHGVTVGSDTTLTATDTTFRDSGRGLDVFRAARVSLARVTASGNAGPGIVINQVGNTSLDVVSAGGNGGPGIVINQAGNTLLGVVSASGNGGPGIVINRAGNTSLGDVSASGNASGLLLRGPLPGLTIVGTVNANHNHAAGVDVVNLGGTTPVGPFHTDHNQTGLLVRNCPGCVLVGLTSSADRRGVTVQRQSTGAVVRDGSVAQAGETGIVVAAAKAELRYMNVGVVDGATGVRLAGSATGAMFEGGAVTGGRLGVSVRAARVAITAVSVTGSSVGFRISSQADGVVLRQIAAKQTGTGLVTQAGPTTVTVSGLRIEQSGGQGVRSYAATLNLDGARISGATIGLNLHGHATVTNSSVVDAAEAVRAGANSQVELTNDGLGANVLGLRVAPSANVTLTDSTVIAPLGARGDVRLLGNTQFPALPLSWLGVFALAALAVAVVLELVRRLREKHRSDRRVRAPAHVTNTA